jgi:hypothetical protein
VYLLQKLTAVLLLFVQGFGQEVTVISTSVRKEKEAREVLKADHFIISKDEAQMSVSSP